jgi:SynChlorMet cassette radical SAM/SPASM protein ScmF
MPVDLISPLAENMATERNIPAPLRVIYFYLSSYCNLNCRHCWIAPTYRQAEEAPAETPLELLKDIVDQALPLGLRSIKITGGEPFLNKNVFSLITHAFKNRISINIETNGTLITDETAVFLKDREISQIAVSLDGADARIHEGLRSRQGCFEKTIEGIKSLVKQGQNVQIIFSVYQENRGYLADTIRLAEHLGAKSFKINCISGVARGGHLKEDGQLLCVSDYIALEKEINDQLQPAHAIQINLDLPAAFKKLKDLKRSRVCGLKEILGILADGSVSICGIGESVPSLKFGNLREKPLADIWYNHPVLNSLREDIPQKLEGICGRCIFKAFCLGKCRAEAYYSTNSFFSPFSFCEEAERLGLFPEKSMLTRNKPDVHNGNTK